MPERTLAIRIDEDLHRQIKIRLAEKGMSLKDYVIDLIKSDLKQDQSKPFPVKSEVNEEMVRTAQALVDFAKEVVKLQNGRK